MKWYYKVVIQNYANFNGRARRMEYWMFVLFQIIIFILMGLVFSNIDDIFSLDITVTAFLIYLTATLIPWLALNVRRLHDVGKSGAYFLINFIPIVGRIWYIIIMASEGELSFNSYGPNPKNPIYEEINEIGKITND